MPTHFTRAQELDPIGSNDVRVDRDDRQTVDWGTSMISVLVTALTVIFWLGVRQFIDADAPRLGLAAVAVSVPSAIAGWIAWRLRTRNDVGDRIATGWQMMAVACIAAVASQIAAIVPQAIGSRTAYTTVLSASLHYLMVAFMLAGLAYWVRRFTPAATLGAILDLAAVGTLGYLTLWNTSLQSTLISNDAPSSLINQINILAYPSSDILLLVAAVAVLSQIGRYELRGAEIMATFGVVALLVADLRFAFEGSASGDVVEAFVGIVSKQQMTLAADTLWYVGFMAIAVGAAVRNRPNTEQEYRVPLIERSSTWELIWTLVPFTMLAIAIASWQGMDMHHGINRTMFLGLIGILITRGGVVAVSNLRRARTGDTDPLTGAFSHTYLQELMPSLVQRAQREGRALSLMTIDIDDFASHNESLGFHEGDRLLREMAYVIRTTLDDNFIMFRPGGDEFAVAMPATTSEEAVDAARMLESTVSRMKIGGVMAPTLTIGIATVPEHTTDPYELIQFSSGSLYHGKQTGKHTITVYDPHAITDLTLEERIRRAETSARLRAVLALARALDARDAYTARHSQNVARYAIAIASQLGWNIEQVELLRIAGLLHDVGKIAVRDSTLRKASSLNDIERREMRQHPEMSAQVIDGVAPDEIIPWVVSHHERWDGMGYPHGLYEDAIPLGARILAVADTFDAMTSSRSYRAPLPATWAVTEIGKCAGEQFDPVVVRAFLQAVSNGMIVVDTEADAEAARIEAERAVPLVDQDVTGTIELEPEFSPLAAGVRKSLTDEVLKGAAYDGLPDNDIDDEPRGIGDDWLIDAA